MKLDPENLKKIFLSLLLFGALLYGYFTMLLGPLNKSEASARKIIEQRDPAIAAANAQIKKTNALKLKAPAAQQTSEQIRALIPEGAPVAWFPPRMVEFFKRHGITRAAVRPSGETAEKDLPEFRSLQWSIDIPKADATQLGIAFEALENEEPLLEITSALVEATSDDVEFQRVLLTVSTIVKQ
jgi:hypothetical protein